MTPVEALAAGTPVIAFNGGGAPEYVREGITGVLFDEQTADSLVEAIKRFHDLKFEQEQLRHEAERFSQQVFRQKMTSFIVGSWKQFEELRKSARSLKSLSENQQIPK